MTSTTRAATDDGLDPLLASPLRLRICGYLAGCEEADFAAVRDYCEITAPTLSKQVTTLLEHGHVAIRKVAAGRYTTTRLSLTDPGRTALDAHVAALRRIVDRSGSAAVAAREPDL